MFAIQSHRMITLDEALQMQISIRLSVKKRNTNRASGTNASEASIAVIIVLFVVIIVVIIIIGHHPEDLTLRYSRRADDNSCSKGL